jgi:hypothetical protein
VLLVLPREDKELTITGGGPILLNPISVGVIPLGLAHNFMRI